MGLWRTDSVTSLASLQAALSAMGPSTRLEKISVVLDDVKESDVSHAVDLVLNVFSMLEFLEDHGCFLLLRDLPAVARELRATVSSVCVASAAADSMQTSLLSILETIFGFLFTLAPKKVYDVLWKLKRFLEEVVDDWDGGNWLDYLQRVYQDLEEVQPRRILNCLLLLYELLMNYHQCLSWLACHPLITEELSTPNIFHKLLSISDTLNALLEDDGSSCLEELQNTLEELDEIQALAHFPA